VLGGFYLCLNTDLFRLIELPGLKPTPTLLKLIRKEIYMYLKMGEEFVDTDLVFLIEILEMLDIKLGKLNLDIQEAINCSADPDSLGYFDRGEYFVGVGFCACQRYLSSTYGPIEIDKTKALKVGPFHEGGLSLATIINVAANYWKHSDEWSVIGFMANNEENELELVIRSIENLNKQQKGTVSAIETVTPWADYTCANILASITPSPEFRLVELIPIIMEWRTELDNLNVNSHVS
jgi:hypothetical protein